MIKIELTQEQYDKLLKECNIHRLTKPKKVEKILSNLGIKTEAQVKALIEK